MSAEDNNFIQISLFSDENTKIDRNCKKIQQNMRDRALRKARNTTNLRHFDCIYNISADDNTVVCQVKNSQASDPEGFWMPPCTEKCGKNCIYYIKARG